VASEGMLQRDFSPCALQRLFNLSLHRTAAMSYFCRYLGYTRFIAVENKKASREGLG
jgi:hypothetical protein